METGRVSKLEQHYKLSAPDVADIFNEQCGSSETLMERAEGEKQEMDLKNSTPTASCVKHLGASRHPSLPLFPFLSE